MEFISFEKEYPKEFTPLLVKLQNGDVVRGYYVFWGNTVYLAEGSRKSKAIKWKYYNEDV